MRGCAKHVEPKQHSRKQQGTNNQAWEQYFFHGERVSRFMVAGAGSCA